MVQTRTGAEGAEPGNVAVRLCEILHKAGSCGFNLSKSKWDPYPWVSTVDAGSAAASAGVLPGDCVLEVNGEDILGLRVAEVAAKVRSRGDRATVMLWNPGIDNQCTPETLCCGPMPTNLQRLTSCMSNILAALECPICLETTTPPTHQCANGHLICLNCRVRTERCPVCRLRFFRGRSLLADQVFESLIDAFDLSKEEQSEQSRLLLQRVYGPRKTKRKSKPEIKLNLLSPTNKFLTRIMGCGKSSSVENLSKSESNEHEGADFYQGLKAKSLSSSEIFEEHQPMSRTSSILSSRPGSGLLDVNDISLGPRPASYHGSAGDLHSRLLTDFGIDITLANHEECACPMAPDCKLLLSPASIRRHLEVEHGNPILRYFSPKAIIPLAWLQDVEGIVILQCFETVFFLRANNDNLWLSLLDGNANDFEVTLNLDDDSILCKMACLSLLDDYLRHDTTLLPSNVNSKTKAVISIKRST